MYSPSNKEKNYQKPHLTIPTSTKLLQIKRTADLVLVALG